MIYYSALRLPDEIILELIEFQKKIHENADEFKIETRYLHATFCFFGKNPIEVTLPMKETIKKRIAQLSENDRKTSFGNLRIIQTKQDWLLVIDLNVSSAIKNLYEELSTLFHIPQHKSPYEPSVTIGKFKCKTFNNDSNHDINHDLQIFSKYIPELLKKEFIIPGVKFVI